MQHIGKTINFPEHTYRQIEKQVEIRRSKQKRVRPGILKREREYNPHAFIIEAVNEKLEREERRKSRAKAAPPAEATQ